MNASSINTAPLQDHRHHGIGGRTTIDDDLSSRLPLLVPTTPSRGGKLQIPSVFATGNTPICSKTPKVVTNSPGKLKIPSAFSHLKSSLEPPCIIDEQEKEDARDVTVAPNPVDNENTVMESSRSVGESSQGDEDQSHKTVKTSNAAWSSAGGVSTAGIGTQRNKKGSSSPSSPKRRKVRKQRSKKLTTAKMQLLAEIDALQKEIEEASLRTSSSRPDTVVRTAEEETTSTEAVAPSPSPPYDVVSIEAVAPDVATETETPDVRSDDDEEDILLLEDASESNHTDDAVMDDVHDASKSRLGQQSPPEETPTEISVPLSLGVDAASIQSPRTKTKTMTKLRSFFRRRKSKKGEKSGLSIIDVLN
jgi:hypothetical protein